MDALCFFVQKSLYWVYSFPFWASFYPSTFHIAPSSVSRLCRIGFASIIGKLGGTGRVVINVSRLLESSWGLHKLKSLLPAGSKIPPFGSLVYL